MSHYVNSTLQTYLNDLAARTPTPGGGSAAALTAALGTALIEMAAHYTVGKPAYAAHEGRMKEMLAVCARLRAEFLRMVDLDCAAYESQNVREALNVPFMVARLCIEAIRLCPELAQKANKNLISDVGVAVALLEAAFKSAYTSVEINLISCNDDKLRKGISKELAQKEKLASRIRLRTEKAVGAVIRGKVSG